MDLARWVYRRASDSVPLTMPPGESQRGIVAKRAAYNVGVRPDGRRGNARNGSVAPPRTLPWPCAAPGKGAYVERVPSRGPRVSQAHPYG